VWIISKTSLPSKDKGVNLVTLVMKINNMPNMKKTLNNLINFFGYEPVNLTPEVGSLNFTGISFSSREIKKNEIFIAIKGHKVDGHIFIEDAFNNGACFAIVQDKISLQGCNYPGVVVENTRQALADIASYLYDDPSNSLKVVGVTGTNGKTTTNWLIYNMLALLEGSSLRLGTLGREGIISKSQKVLQDPDTLTTSDPIYLNYSLAQANNLGITNCVMEVSSHALEQDRATAINFDVAVFTNLTQDHLDYHLTFENYYSAKKILFYKLASSKKHNKTAVININCDYGKRLKHELSSIPVKIITFGDGEEADIKIGKISQSIEGSSCNITVFSEELQLKTKFIGHHNAENFYFRYYESRSTYSTSTRST
jgi:UDP-N-acetylmuramoyl-L-alanyl-D-glutamate--2,6-diaminopimelate ligase